MPRTRFDKPRYPPVDWLMAAILERKKVMKLEWKDIADEVGMSPEALRKMVMTKAPAEWTKETRDKILKVLGLRAKLVIEDLHEVSL